MKAPVFQRHTKHLIGGDTLLSLFPIFGGNFVYIDGILCETCNFGVVWTYAEHEKGKDGAWIWDSDCLVSSRSVFEIDILDL